MPRNYSSIASVKTLTSNVTTTATTISLNNLTGLPTPPYTLVLNPDTTIEEIVTVDSVASGTTLNVSRAQESTTAQAHSTGNSVRHMITGRDLQDAQDHIANTTTAHGTAGGVVGVTSNQTLSNKNINLSSNTLSGTRAQFNAAMSDDDFATLTGTETLTNKTVRDSTFFISDETDTTKKLQFQVSGLTTGTTRTLTVPDASGTIITSSDTGTVTSAMIANGTIVDADISSTAAIAWSKMASDTNNNYANPVGMLAPFAGSTAPTGWFLCDGEQYSQTTYASLYLVIGSTYNTGGETAGYFRVPDLRGRVVAGTDNMGTARGDGGRLDWANTLGTNGGAQTHTLSSSEIPAHSHNLNVDGVSGGVATTTGPGHLKASGATLGREGSPGTPISLTNAVAQNTGGGGAHNNMQPTILLNYIIKY